MTVTGRPPGGTRAENVADIPLPQSGGTTPSALVGVPLKTTTPPAVIVTKISVMFVPWVTGLEKTTSAYRGSVPTPGNKVFPVAVLNEVEVAVTDIGDMDVVFVVRLPSSVI